MATGVALLFSAAGVAALAPLPHGDAARLTDICMPLLPGRPTASSECTVERLEFGNTNRLFSLARARGDRFLVREFGMHTALALDRGSENRVYSMLSRRGLAPKLIGTFDGGRIEAWLDGQPCTPSECRSPAVASAVARSLAALHQLPLDELPETARAWGWTRARAWLRAAQASAAAIEAIDAKLARRVAALDLDRVSRLLEQLLATLEARELTRCFCHNDLSNTNVHREPTTGHVALIDFEFAGENYRGFDLATHFSHWAGGAVDGRYDHGAYPTVEEQRPFLEAYARARLGAERRVQPSDVDSAEVSALVDALAAEASAAAPLAHCVWGLWALCALPAAVAAAGGGCDGSCGFSHIEYAERRLGAFFASFEATPLFEEELNLIYDSKCSVCRWEVQNLRSLGAEGKIRFTDLEGSDYDASDARNGGVTYEEGMRALHAVRRDGRLLTGVPVFGAAYGAVGVGWLGPFSELPVLRDVLGALYARFAALRTVLTRGRSVRELVDEREARMRQ